MIMHSHRSLHARHATRRHFLLATAGATLGVLLGGGAMLAQAVATKAVVDKTTKIAPGLYEIVASPSRGRIYVASIGSREPQVGAKILGLDPTSLAVKETIDVAEAPAFGLGINDKTQTLYTTNTRSGSVSVIDLKTAKVVSTIKVDSDPKAHLFRVLVDEAKNIVYVSVVGGRVWVIDGKTNTLSHVIEEVGKTTVGLALDPATNRLFAANSGSKDIAVIDLETRKVTSRFAAPGDSPTMLAFDAQRKRLFVTNQGTGDVSVLDATTGAIVKAVKTGEGALGIAINPATSLVYVANRQASTITVIDAATLDVVADLPAGSRPNTVAVDGKTNRIYVTNKSKSAGRGAPPVEDPAGDTVTIVRS